MNIIQQDGNLYLSTKYLKTFSTPNTIKKWRTRYSEAWIMVDETAYMNYNSIPKGTKKHIGSVDRVISLENKKATQSKVKELLHDAYWYKFSFYKSIYECETSFTTEQVTKFSRLHSVFQTILDLKEKESFRQLELLLEAFNDLFPGKYKTKQAFSQAILKAKVEGVMSIALDKRTFGNNNRENRATTPQVDYVIAALVAYNGKLTNAEMLEKANAYFLENGLKQLGLSWMKKQRREWLKNIEIYKSRYGQIEATKKMPFASMKHASYVHGQWQCDGVKIPFWKDGFKSSILVYVIDNCSKKIIGYAIGDTENGEVIKSAIRNAVYSTGVLPNELVMDNHSFTRTISAANFEGLLNKVGAKLTKTSNPQHKSIVERYSRNLHSLYKFYPGFLGLGIRSKSLDFLVSAEQTGKYAKNFKSEAEIIAITASVVMDYNNKAQRGKTPNQIFEENPHPNPIVLNQFNRAELLPNQQEKKISRGQITIYRGIEKFEYQLPAALYQKWNDETVIISYDDLEDGIYLFDKSNGEGIKFLQLKGKINNAIALQTDADILALNKTKGKRNGIETAAKKQLQNLSIAAHGIDPEAQYKVNPLITPKDIIKELAENANLKSCVEAAGVIISELPTTNETFDMPAALKPIKKDSNPFTVTNNKIEVIDPTKLLDDDFDN